MSKAAERIIAAKDGKQSLQKLRDAVKAKGLSVEYGATYTGNVSPQDEVSRNAGQELMKANFDKLILLVGIERSGEIDVSEEISKVMSELAYQFVAGGERLHALGANALRDRSGNFASTNKDIIGCIESAYNEVCGPAKNAGKVV